MYINYEKIGKILGFGQKFFYQLKIASNCAYIRKNIKAVKKKLKGKTQLIVAFYVYDDTKWKCQSVYDLMEKDSRFVPYIFATKNAAVKENFNYQDKTDVEKVYNFFKVRNMRVKYAYDTQAERFIPFEDMSPKPDIIIYQHPWYVETSQGPVVCSKFALTYYVPYYISDVESPIEYDLRFHRYIYRYFVPDEVTRRNYAPNMYDKGAKLVVAGHPQLDYYLGKDDEASEASEADKESEVEDEADKKYTIYAPHWSVCGNNLRYGTFDWNGYEILRFAESHPELNWVFKPHPLLYRFMYTSGFMKRDEVDEYYERWRRAGLYYDEGDYMDLFRNSRAMITDSGSFLIEYFFSKQPCIHLVSEHFTGNENSRRICSTYYNAYNLDELNRFLDEVLIKNNDYKKPDRLGLLAEMNYPYSAGIIVNDIAKNLC